MVAIISSAHNAFLSEVVNWKKVQAKKKQKQKQRWGGVLKKFNKCDEVSEHLTRSHVKPMRKY